jgi:hypothetical protein
VPGTFVLKTTDGILSGLQLGSISNSGVTDFVFDLQNSNYVLKVANTSNYADNINSTNDIPNVQYLYNYVAAQGGIAATDRLFYPITGNFSSAQSSIQAFASSMRFSIAGSARAVISAAGLSVDNINVYQNSITNVSTNNLLLTASNNNVEVNGVLNLDDQIVNPAFGGGATKIYSKQTPGPGKTGIFFTNQNASQTPDELVSRSRAVALSILL